MSGVIESKFSRSIPNGEIKDCINSLQECLAAINETPYHEVLDLNFLHQVDEVAQFISGFYREATENTSIGAMYFEMNGFAINPDLWFFNGFGFEKGGDIVDLTFETEWLEDWSAETDEFTLTGMENVQAAFSKLYRDETQPLSVELAGEIAQCLVIARFNELINASHKVAKGLCPELDGLPVLSTAHDWDTLCPSP